MLKLVALTIAACSLFGCATDAPPSEHTLEWTLEAGLTIDPGVCKGIRITGTTLDEIRLGCGELSTTLTIDPDDPHVQVAVDYRFTQIPQGCESEACWREATMATGTAEVDTTSASTAIVVERVISLPF